MLLKKIIHRVLPMAWKRKLMDRTYAFFVFSKFDSVKFDYLGYKYAVPEPVAELIAADYSNQTVLDPFAGLGGTVIAFARNRNRVVALENNRTRFEYLRSNVGAYGCDDHVELHQLGAEEFLKSDRRNFQLIFLDPPWGERSLDLNRIIQLFAGRAEEIIFKIPKEYPNDLILASGAGRIREIFINSTLFLKFAYYGRNPGAAQIGQDQINLPAMSYILP